MSAHPPDRYAVIGHPVAHSQSPFIHAEFARQTGHPIAYERVLSPLDGFESTLAWWAASGARGCNVTVPFKFEVPRLVAGLSARVRLAQAANTVRFDAQGGQAENTDGLGLVADIQTHAGLPLKGTTVLLLGAGGASAGVLGPLLAAGPARVVLVNRTVDKAVALAAAHEAWAREHGSEIRAGGLTEAAALCGTGCQVLINGTASSLAGDRSPVAEGILRTGGLAVDMMYGAPALPFLQWAQAQGAQARDGLGMLVEQAAEAFAFWRGVRPHTPPVLAALRQRLAAG
ncbi:MAG: shikimate dehydrogenase [Betaproteobacteria bacterium]